MIEQYKNAISYINDGEKVRIEAWGKNALRVRATKNAAFTDNDWALNEPAACTPEVIVTVDDTPLNSMNAVLGGAGDPRKGVIRNGKIRAEINRFGVITFFNDKGKQLLKEHLCSHTSDPHMSINRSARELRASEGENFKITMRFEPNDEKLFGMGQYQMQEMDMKGCVLELSHRNSQISIPFVLSSNGYGFLWNNPAIGHAVFGKNETEWVAESTKQMDYWIVVGDSPAEIEEAYANAVGKVPMMPDYGMGFWQCKLRYHSQEEVLSVARKHKSLGLPLDGIVIDFFHWPKEGDWKFDKKFFPDPAAMCKELNNMGIQVMVSIWPTVASSSENFDEMRENGYLVHTRRGVPITMDMGLMDTTVFFDPTNPGSREFVWSKAKQNYWDNGVRLFWLDEAEPEYSAYDYDNYRYYMGTDLEVGNIYPLMYAKAFYDGMKKTGMEAPVNLLRCAWAGSQKYGALVWSGDINATFECLRRQVKAGLSMGIAGIPWWTTDIGGFYDCDINDPEFHKVLIRWFEFGCFSPVFRLHGCRTPFKPVEGALFSGAENEVWSYGEENFEIMKKYLFLRERLRPYIKEQMSAAHEKGTPIMRPLFYDFPKDDDAWGIEDEYMFGPDILVAPVMEKDAFAREVYFPAGATWTNAWTGEKYEGGSKRTIGAPFDTIPVFTRDDVVLPIKV